jgi:hypothetical protein
VTPFAVIEDDDAVIKEVVALAAPGTKETLSVSEILTPPTVPVMIEVPALTDEVKVAV